MIAVVHDWIFDIAGAEACLKEIYSIFPDSKIFTLFYREDSLKALGIDKEVVCTSFLQRWPKIDRYYRYCLPLWPFAIEQINVRDYKLVISSSHAVAKGVLTYPDQIHICYCYTPIRYVWDLYFLYLEQTRLDKGIKSLLVRWMLHKIRLWDVATVNRVDHFVAISNYVAKRIKRYYGRNSTVIYPPVDVDKFSLCREKEDFYLTVSRLVPYKRVDLIVRAFSQMPNRKLVVIGDGPQMKELKGIASKNVELLGYQPFEVMKQYLEKARAFVFAAEEDFGIAPVEAQACGTPVIGYARGGLAETVVDGKTGVFFSQQTVEAIKEAIKRFESMEGRFSTEEIRSNAERFSREEFRRKFAKFINEKLYD